MKTSITKWGNSLGIRIPKSIAEQAMLKEGTIAELSFANDKIVIKKAKKYDLKEMLSKISPVNLHNNLDESGEVGSEKLEW